MKRNYSGHISETWSLDVQLQARIGRSESVAGARLGPESVDQELGEGQ